MISDNYTIILLAIVSLLVLAFAARYFGVELYNSLSLYREGVRKQMDTLGKDGGITAAKLLSQDDEDYDEDGDVTSAPFDVSTYYEQGKKSFVDKVTTQYKEYNKLKGEYIQVNYSKPNDDPVDQDLFYKRHDDYSYAKDGVDNK